jgi:hypothetical protein
VLRDRRFIPKCFILRRFVPGVLFLGVTGARSLSGRVVVARSSPQISGTKLVSTLVELIMTAQGFICPSRQGFMGKGPYSTLFRS